MYYALIVVICISFLFNVPVFASNVGYFSDSINQLQESARLASRAESLEGVREQAKAIMVLAEEFQKQAQQVEDHGFVNEAIDIYNSAYRALKSSSFEEARSYAHELVSHAEIISQQSGLSHHIPDSYFELQEENWGDDPYREQYPKEMP